MEAGLILQNASLQKDIGLLGGLGTCFSRFLRALCWWRVLVDFSDLVVVLHLLVSSRCLRFGAILSIIVFDLLDFPEELVDFAALNLFVLEQKDVYWQ